MKTHEPLPRHRQGRRRDADVQGRRGHHVPEEHGREADASPSTASSSPATASTRRGRPHGLSRQGREGRGGRLARRHGAARRRRRRITGVCSRAGAATPSISSRPRRSIGREALARQGRGGAAAGARRSEPRRRSAPDFTTSQRLDQPIPPNVTADDEFFTFLFSRAPVRYDELKRKADGAGPAAVVPARRRHDHVQRRRRLRGRPHAAHAQRRRHRRGQRSAAEEHLRRLRRALRSRRLRRGRAARTTAARSAPGRVTAGTERRSHLERRRRRRVGDGGADGAGASVRARGRGRSGRCSSSGTPARSAACSARGTSPTTRRCRSTGIVAQLNIDMIGRNRDDKPSEANTVYLVGSDRISSELHEINRAANRALPKPLTLDYEMNDPSGPRAALLPQRPLQLRGEGDSDHLLHDRPAPRLPREHRRGVEDRVRQDDADHAARLRDRTARRQPRSCAGARQQGTARRA